jgi:hypothetical protein
MGALRSCEVPARPAIFVLPHQDAAWKIIRDRLEELVETCAALGQQAGLGALAPLAVKLHSMSQDIAAHIPRQPPVRSAPATPAERNS